MWYHMKIIINNPENATFKFAAHWIHWNERTQSEFKKHPVKYGMRANIRIEHPCVPGCQQDYSYKANLKGQVFHIEIVSSEETSRYKNNRQS